MTASKSFAGAGRSVVQEPGELAVDDQVRVPPDRRREVAVVGRGQSVVPAALLAVNRLALRPQEQVVEQPFLGLALDLLEQLLERRGRHLLEIALEVVAEALEDVAQVRELVRVGPVVDAVDRGLFGEEELLGHRLVGREHELLDQPVRDVAGFRHDAHDEAGVVEHDVGVRKVEVDRAPGFAPFSQERGDLAHPPEVLEERPVVALVHRRRRRLQQARHLRVGHPVRRCG